MSIRFTNQPTLLLFLGPQGSGKGTQVALLNEIMHLPVITMGEVFRTEAAKDTARGKAVKAIIDPGGIVHAELWEEVLRDYIQDLDASAGALLDGVVRSEEQVTAFDRIRSELALPDPYIVNIRIPQEESIKRLLLRGRHDDTEAAIRKRLKWSAKQTESVIHSYQARDRVIEIDGDMTIPEVHTQIVRKLTQAGLIEESHEG